VTAIAARRTRRRLVVAALAVCAFLVAAPSGSLHGAGITAVLVLAVIDVALLFATGGLAFARPSRLDERLAAKRDLAYRRGFRLLGLGLVLGVVEAYLATVIAFFHAASDPSGINQLDTGISAQVVLAVLELLAMTPTLVLAWTEPDAPGDEPGPSGPRLLGTAALTAGAIVAAWLAAVAWAPAEAAGSSHNVGDVFSGATCRRFAAGRMVGAQLGATVGLRVDVCWNGRQAFVFGDPRVPSPLSEQMDPRGEPWLTACGADNLDDFARVTSMTCTVTTDADGTLRYSVRARVQALPVPIGVRDVRMDLVVTRDGAVLSQP
jgi:hypothetical protein